MKIEELTKKQLELLKICYYSICNTTDELIESAVYKNLDIEETCEVPQSIRTIEIYNTAISNNIKLNGKDITNPNIEW